MTDHVWCHGPSCHKRSTTSRIRGSKGSKVLRTIKIAVNGYRANTMWKYFCDQTCLMDFIRTHLTSIVAIAPRREALETPIKDPVKDSPSGFGRWTIEERT